LTVKREVGRGRGGNLTTLEPFPARNYSGREGGKEVEVVFVIPKGCSPMLFLEKRRLGIQNGKDFGKSQLLPQSFSSAAGEERISKKGEIGSRKKKKKTIILNCTTTLPEKHKPMERRAHKGEWGDLSVSPNPPPKKPD